LIDRTGQISRSSMVKFDSRSFWIRNRTGGNMEQCHNAREHWMAMPWYHLRWHSCWAPILSNTQNQKNCRNKRR
jgi:hypothetical protein